MTTEGPTRLYRWYDQDGTLLYIGISVRPYERAHEHVKASKWVRWATRMEIDPAVYPDRAAALAAEGRAILEESPVFNIAGAVLYWSRMNPYLVAKGEDPIPEPAAKPLRTAGGEPEEIPLLMLHPEHPLALEIAQMRETALDLMRQMEADPDKWQALAAARELTDLLQDLVGESSVLRSRIAVDLYGGEGVSLAYLAGRLGVTRARAHQIVTAGRKRNAAA